jgi:N-methylhydantoinase A
VWGGDAEGTFTDIVCIDPGGELFTQKVPSMSSDYSQAIQAGLRALLAAPGVDGASIEEPMPGATVASHAILECKGAITGLVTTKGFRDVLEIWRLRMPHLDDATAVVPPGCSARLDDWGNIVIQIG